MTVVSAPAGSGKTVLLRSWISQAGLEGSATWVPAEREERDPQRFWLSVLGALRQTTAGSGLVRELSAAPDLDGWAVVERLLKDLAPLEDRIWLVIDDVHHLGSAEALRQLELLLMRAPPPLRFVLATRHDLRLGLHRLRLEGELAEIRAGDLRFTLAEARELFAAAGVQLSEPELARLHERTEGWAAGLRLAALSLSGHPDPARFAAEFSGTERTVADYLLAEVLERQSEQVRRLLLRTSVLERVRPAGRCPDRRQRRGAGAAGPGGGRCVRGVAGRRAVLVPLPPAVRRPAAAGAAAHRAGRGDRAARRRLAGGSPGTGTRPRRSATPRPPATGASPPACSPTTGPGSTWTGRTPPSTSCWPSSPPPCCRRTPSSQ